MNRMDDLLSRIGGGYRVSYDEAVALARTEPLEELRRLAHSLRTRYHDNHIDTCSIMNARSGRCSEDCKWCSQSRFHETHVDVYPLVGAAEAVDLARHNAAKGVGRFSLVTSGRTLSAADTRRICDIYRRIGADVPSLGLCASLGLLDLGQMKQLRAAGVTRYHCNLETAPSYFSQLCTTHTTGEKVRTIGWAHEAGLEVCSGGIIGMGETLEQRIELAVMLREIGVVSIPVNVLNPIPGTPLAGTPPLPPDEILLTMALFRIVNPEAHIRLAGGRNLLRPIISEVLHSGVSALIVGDMLTTLGSDIDSDKAMFAREGFRTA